MVALEVIEVEEALPGEPTAIEVASLLIGLLSCQLESLSLDHHQGLDDRAEGTFLDVLCDHGRAEFVDMVADGLLILEHVEIFHCVVLSALCRAVPWL